MIDIQDEILKTIKLIVDNATASIKNSDVEVKVLSKNSDGTYKVKINGVDYNVKNGTSMSFKTGDKVLVHLINGNFNNKVIIAKL